MEDLSGQNIPLVSISCITYNHADFIRNALDGFLMQKTSFPFEILVYDDASTDGTANIIREYENNHPDLIFPLYQTENQYSKGVRGISSRFNAPRARGKYIAKCEGDDYWTDPLKLQKQIDFLEAHPEYIMCWTRFMVLNHESGEMIHDKNEGYFKGGKDCIDFDLEKFYKGWHIGMQTLVFKKEIYQTGYLNKYKSAKDIHLVTELLLNGKGACLNFYGGVYRLHPNGIYSNTTLVERSKSAYTLYREIYRRNNGEFFLKLKYINFAKKYVETLLEQRKFFSAMRIAVEVMLVEKKSGYLAAILNYIVKDLKKGKRA